MMPPKEKDVLFILMELIMKEIGLKIDNMVWVQKYGRMEVDTKENIKMVCDKEMGIGVGQMGVSIKVDFIKEK